MAKTFKQFYTEAVETSAKQAYDRAIRNGPNSSDEVLIAKNAQLSLQYALNVLKVPFLRGERAILTDAKAAYEYARKIIRGPWKKAEDIIATDAKIAYDYAVNFLKGAFPKGEKAILDSEYKNDYLKLIGK